MCALCSEHRLHHYCFSICHLPNIYPHTIEIFYTVSQRRSCRFHQQITLVLHASQFQSVIQYRRACRRPFTLSISRHTFAWDVRNQRRERLNVELLSNTITRDSDALDDITSQPWNGFVDTVLKAYNQHHNLEIRYSQHWHATYRCSIKLGLLLQARWCVDSHSITVQLLVGVPIPIDLCPNRRLSLLMHTRKS